jgi:hypothetical protein
LRNARDKTEAAGGNRPLAANAEAAKERHPVNRKPKAAGKEVARLSRDQRLAEALRANLKRRKAAAGPGGATEAKPPPKPRQGDLE